MENVYQVYGLLASMVSDFNCNFDGHFWMELIKRVDTLLNISTTNHYDMVGKTKHVNQALQDMLQVYANKHQSNWKDYFPTMTKTPKLA